MHPDDVKRVLETEGEFICYADKSSDEAVFVQIDNKGSVLAFSRERGEYEWTGPACIRKSNLSYSAQNVFNIIEPHLPVRGFKIQAYDIDTYGDYLRVSKIIQNWT